MAKLNIEGERYGRLLVLQRSERISRNGKTYLTCICDCGRTVDVYMGNLRNGHTKSCGCYNLEIVTKHGHCRRSFGKTSTRNSYRAMMSRCYRSGDKAFKRYGGASMPVTVCARWRKSFVNFLSDMGERPPNTSLGRKHTTRIYSKRNCAWQTRLEQAADMTRTRWVTIDGSKLTLTQACERLSIKYSTVNAYINRYKMSPQRALNHVIKRGKEANK